MRIYQKQFPKAFGKPQEKIDASLTGKLSSDLVEFLTET